MTVIDNMMLAAPDQPGERLRNALLPPGGAASARARGPRQARWSCSSVFDLDRLADALRRHALRRPAQAARAGAGADGAAAAAAARRADGRDQPDPRPPPARPHAAPAARGGDDVPLHRARHGGGDEPRRPGDRDGRGAGDRRRRAARGPRRPGGDRRLPRGTAWREERSSGDGAADGALLEADDLVAGYAAGGRHPQRRLAHRRRGRDRDRRRPERGRQVDADQDDLRAAGAAPGAGDAPRART